MEVRSVRYNSLALHHSCREEAARVRHSESQQEAEAVLRTRAVSRVSSQPEPPSPVPLPAGLSSGLDTGTFRDIEQQTKLHLPRLAHTRPQGQDLSDRVRDLPVDQVS